MSADQARAAAPAAAGRRAWLVALVLWLPYMLVWLAPALFAHEGLVPTGFVQHDQPYYLANGRAVFERGNGLLGPNPFDPDPAAPAIYFHWLTWLMGALTVFAALDPGAVYVVIGGCAGLLFSWLTLALMDQLTRGSPRAPWLAALAMWGGGMAFIAHAITAALQGDSALQTPLALAPMEGWWFLPWGPNVLYATEAVYHVLVLGVWLAWLNRRWGRMLGCTAAIASTHPFTGAQTLAWLGVWLALNQLAPQKSGVTRVPLRYCALFAAIGLSFTGYYFVYLPRFPQHLALAQVWSLPWQETPLETLLAYTPVAALAALATRSKQALPQPEARFFGVVAAVSFVLAHHHWVVTSHQPLHFTHGYLWFALLLLGLPYLDARLARWVAGPAPRARVAVVAVMVLACSDNIAFVLKETAVWNRHGVTVIDRELRALYARIDRERLHGVLLSDDLIVSYLAASYTPLRPYIGHVYNTPRFHERAEQLNELSQTGSSRSWFEQVDVLVLRKRLPASDSTWTPVQLGARFNLYRRPSAARPQ